MFTLSCVPAALRGGGVFIWRVVYGARYFDSMSAVWLVVAGLDSWLSS